MRLLWLVPERSGGIHSYATELWPCVEAALRAHAPGCELEIEVTSLATRRDVDQCLARIEALAPTHIHIQHEYGLFGSKLPGRYLFPRWLAGVRRIDSIARVTATAHTVLSPSFTYALAGHGRRAPLRLFANLTWVPLARSLWGRSTWGQLDGVVVHSGLQRDVVESAGAPSVEVIPHYAVSGQVLSPAVSDPATLLVFGYISPEKGQDLAIRALAGLRQGGRNVNLVLAGGLRRAADAPYERHCLELIERFGLMDHVEITGYLPDAAIDRVYARATLAIAPFRDTSGSGSVVQALVRGIPLLASDLPLNREIADREPGALALFRAGDAEDCVSLIARVLARAPEREALRAAGLRYAEQISIEKIARRYADFLLAGHIGDQARI